MRERGNTLKWILIHSIVVITLVVFSYPGHGQESEDLVKVLKEKLNQLEVNTSVSIFKTHLQSIEAVIDFYESKPDDLNLLHEFYLQFEKDNLSNPSLFESYLKRERMLIIAWESQTDKKVSFGWLKLPKNWDPEKEYPLYVQLHGYWDVADSPINFMTFTFLQKPMKTIAFEDGYFFAPWGRGNQWYHGISKTDVREGLMQIEDMLKIQQSRKYLTGHSMGGYGTWHIAQESPDDWAGIGIHSGALWFNNEKYVTAEYAQRLSNLPVYFCWGNKEQGLKKANIRAKKLLQQAENPDVFSTEFEGGHDYLEEDVEKMYLWLRDFKRKE